MNPRKPTGKYHRAIIIHPKKIKWKVWAFKNSDHFQTTHKKRKKKKKKTYGSSWNKQKPMRDTENPVKSLQGIGVLDISFKHFQGVLERLSHGSYVHLPRTKKVRTFSRKTETKIKITECWIAQEFWYSQNPETLIRVPEKTRALLSRSRSSGLSLSETQWRGER